MTNLTPAAPRRRARRKEARPGEILQAALTVFARRGYAATKLEEVAATAGIGKGTIYLYFQNKEELFRAVVRQRLVPNLDEIEAVVAAHQGSSADLLRLVAERMFRLIDSEVVALPKLVIAESGNFPALARFYADAVVKRGVGLFARIIARGIQRGEFRPVDPLSVVPTFAGPFMMLAVARHAISAHTDFAFDAKRVLATHLDVVLRGLAAEPKP